MPSLTTNYGFKLPLVDNPTEEDLWGTYLNANWTSIDAILKTLGPKTGDVQFTIRTTADAGWVMMDDGTIGNASSGATNRANADTEALFTLLWNDYSNAYAPVSGGRGASASADFSAGKTISLLKALGRLFGVAGSGAGLTTRALGETLGEETHTLSVNEMPSHTHTATDTGHTHGSLKGNFFGASGGSASTVGGGSGGFANTTDIGNAAITVSSAGSGQPHNNMPPAVFINAMIKL